MGKKKFIFDCWVHDWILFDASFFYNHYAYVSLFHRMLLCLLICFQAPDSHIKTNYRQRSRQVIEEDRQNCAFYAVTIAVQVFHDTWTSLAPFYGIELARALALQDRMEAADDVWSAAGGSVFDADTVLSILQMLGLRGARINGARALDVPAFRTASRYSFFPTWVL